MTRISKWAERLATGIIRYHAHWIMMMPESKYEKISKFGMLAAGANAWVKLGQTTRIGMCVCVRAHVLYILL